MSKKPIYATAGTETEKIDIRLSYRIVRLFSEGLYASPNKAIEELVANSFDAGARLVAVFLPADFHDQGATITVLDDGEGMDVGGLKQHWLIGKSDKRDLVKLPLGRQQIGKFGIGKLATYVLANRLTHISKKGGKYYSTSMNFKNVDDRGDEEVEPKTPIKISLRELTEHQAKEALNEWRGAAAFKKCGFKLFGAVPPSHGLSQSSLTSKKRSTKSAGPSWSGCCAPRCPCVTTSRSIWTVLSWNPARPAKGA